MAHSSTTTDRKCEEDHSVTDSKSSATTRSSSERTIRVLEGPETSPHISCGWGRLEAARLLQGQAVAVQVGRSTPTTAPQLRVYQAAGDFKVTFNVLPEFSPVRWHLASDEERARAAEDDENTVNSHSANSAT